jgi:hypothetical protein
VGENALKRLRMADREAHVAAFNARSEQLARRTIGYRDNVTVDDERRLVESIDD